jgi:predicted DNA-binding transcriptional regulator AlpA
MNSITFNFDKTLNDSVTYRSSTRRGAIASPDSRYRVIAMGLDPMLRMNDVEALTGLGASMIYKMMSEATFPKSIPLTPNGRARGWRLSSINAWMTERVRT